MKKVIKFLLLGLAVLFILDSLPFEFDRDGRQMRTTQSWNMCSAAWLYPALIKYKVQHGDFPKKLSSIAVSDGIREAAATQFVYTHGTNDILAYEKGPSVADTRRGDWTNSLSGNHSRYRPARMTIFVSKGPKFIPEDVFQRDYAPSLH